MKSPIRTLALWLALTLAPAAAMAAAPDLQINAESLSAASTQAVPASDAQLQQDPPPAAETSAASGSGPSVDKGDVAWMLTSTVLVVAMIVPGLALFYGGLMRAKNMLSVLMQVFVVFSMVTLLWVIYGYSMAFTGTGSFFGSFDKLFLSGVNTQTLSDTFSENAKLPEYVFVSFQATFAAITCCLIVGAFAERIKITAVLLFMVLWFTFSYLPVAHMVWHSTGYLFKDGALDFAGGTVVHINAGVAGLVGAYMVGKRIGFGREAMPPHSLTMTMIGASLLWVGWFGFNAGSNLEASSGAALPLLNTIVATSAATLAWCAGEALARGKASMLGAASGAIAGLVAITPACGTVGPMGAIVIGVVAGFACLWGVTGLKRMLGVDDAADVFGVHGVGGIVGALLTGVFTAPWLGGTGAADFAIGHQFFVQLKGVVLTIVWSGVVSIVAYKLVDLLVGLRVSEEDERQGLDTSWHGESAYAK
ncbi:MAG TPA: ammonium transporter [Burkholderiaceae bacterium]|nr:ammonium transporter [Burkholderiaceae bacterium]